MTANPFPDPARVSSLAHGHTRLAAWAVGLAAAVVVMVVASYAIFAVAWVFGGQDAVSDNWVGLLAAVALVGGLAVSFAAAVLAGLMVGSSVFAASRAGGPLYGTRLALEELTLPTNAQARLEAELGLAQGRLAEIVEGVSKGDQQAAAAALTAYLATLDDLGDSTGGPAERALDAISKHQAVLEEVLGKAPEQARTGLENALLMSGKVIERLDAAAGPVGAGAGNGKGSGSGKGGAPGSAGGAGAGAGGGSGTGSGSGSSGGGGAGGNNGSGPGANSGNGPGSNSGNGPGTNNGGKPATTPRPAATPRPTPKPKPTKAPTPAPETTPTEQDSTPTDGASSPGDGPAGGNEH
jgi:hypothetical protein